MSTLLVIDAQQPFLDRLGPDAPCWGGIADALARHAPDVPVVDLAATDTGAMDLVVARAADLAHEGDVVLLAPAAASMDMFDNYGARGDAFVAAVRRLARAAGE